MVRCFYSIIWVINGLLLLGYEAMWVYKLRVLPLQLA